MKDYALDAADYCWNRPVEYDPVMQLDNDLERAMKKMQETQRIEKELPGIDCSACGSPRAMPLRRTLWRERRGCPTACLF